MLLFTIKKSSIMLVVSMIQVQMLFFYFSINIINVGGMGTALPLLVGFIVLASIVLFIKFILNKSSLCLRWHFPCFLFFVFWISFRVIVDSGDMEHLKQITIATTGGVLLFFLLGALSREVLNTLTNSSLKPVSSKLILLTFLLVSSIVFFNFKGRLLDRDDIIYVAGVDGGYQRPGDFLIMLFILVSFAFVFIASHPSTRKLISLFLWLGIYSVGLALALINSQMIGSNAATANLLAIYLMTNVLASLGFNKSIRSYFFNKKLDLPLSKLALREFIKYGISALVVFVFLAVIALQLTGFDLNKTRAFGFGSGTNSSITSRFDILLESGIIQMSYAPFLGNVNVAEITTGNASIRLHNFLPNVLAELGLVGVLLVLIIFFLVGWRLVVNIRKYSKEGQDLTQTIINLWLLFMLLFLFLYSNISVGKSWSVMWFFMGFAVSVFYRKNIIIDSIHQEAA